MTVNKFTQTNSHNYLHIVDPTLIAEGAHCFYKWLCSTNKTLYK
uniref:Uncharacterized protein n=1 Tax=Anguilla anguilla TaxID=7936 RepID=A0A0E9SHX0_ANGAN